MVIINPEPYLCTGPTTLNVEIKHQPQSQNPEPSNKLGHHPNNMYILYIIIIIYPNLEP